MNSTVARPLGSVVHLPRPIFVVTRGYERFAVEQSRTVSMRVQIGGVRHIIARPFQPVDEVVLIYEFAVAVHSVGPVERHLRRASSTQSRRRPNAVVVVKTLAGLAVVWIVVVRLVGYDRLLV